MNWYDRRTLDQCFNAKVKGRIYCAKGHQLSHRNKQGTLPLSLLKASMEVCQGCSDFDFHAPLRMNDDKEE